jgi:hypothetical protein
MPLHARLLAAPLLLALFAPFAPAQHPGNFPDTPAVIPSELMPPPTPSSASLPEVPLPWQVDLILGFPSGVRAQRTLFGGPWMVEGFAGLELILPAAGLGFRRQCVVLEGACNALMINPGSDFYLCALPHATSWGDRGSGSVGWRGAGAVITDIDLIWRHAVGNGAESQVGLKLGAGPVFSRHGSGVVPVVGLFLGWGF